MPRTTIQRDPKENVQLVVNFLDSVRDKHQLKNDAALSRFAGLPPPILSKLRHGHLNFTAYHVVKFEQATGRSNSDIMAAVGYNIKTSMV